MGRWRPEAEGPPAELGVWRRAGHWPGRVERRTLRRPGARRLERWRRRRPGAGRVERRRRDRTGARRLVEMRMRLEAEGAGGWIRSDVFFSFFAFWIHRVHRRKAAKYCLAKARRSLRSKNIGGKIGALLIPNYPVYICDR